MADYNHLRIITEDGVELGFGDNAYNYYDMQPGKIGRIDAPYDHHGQGTRAHKNQDIWFEFNHDDGSTSLLNGQRICTRFFAKSRGFRGV